MNHQNFKSVIDQTFETMHKLTESKGVEYANSDDQLANFKRLSEELDLSPEAVNLVFLTKHIDSIKNFVRSGGQSESEPIFGRIDDAILYLILLKSIITEKRAISPVVKEDDIKKPIDDLVAEFFSGLQANAGSDEECDCPSCALQKMFAGTSIKVSVMSADDIPNFLKKQDGEKN
jgi:hypothetical protein